MGSDAILQNVAHTDISTRFVTSNIVVASPAGASETVIASLSIPANVAVINGIVVQGFAAFTIGTNGVSYNLKLRQTGTSGTTVVATGVIAQSATTLCAQQLLGLDTAAVTPGQVYVMTLTVASGSATSTVSAVTLSATVV
jgi:hypothetical protein